jgi:hypothetical protein
MIDALATEPHFAAHIRPVWDALPIHADFLTTEGPAGARISDTVIVASYGDHKRARAMGYQRIVRMEHGAGQSYAGDPQSASVPNYAGGRDADDVGLFIVPGPHPAARWQAAYPAARVAQVGLTKALPGLEPGDRPVVALSFHFAAYLGCPEGDGALRWYRNAIPQLAKRYALIGHAHPRHASRVRPWFARSGVPFVTDFEEVCRRASVYACDNSSTLFEFAATGRPVVLLNGPHYRRSVEHGLRFWEAAHVGIQAQPATVIAAIDRALEDRADEQRARAHALELVYSQPTGGAQLAAAAIGDWLGKHEEAAA